MTDTVWTCEQVRAGQICNRVTFNTQREAEDFASRMSRMEPDIFWRIEAIPVQMVWN